MRVVFMGTPDFAVPSLRLLVERHDVTLALTRPDAVRGRGKRLEPSAVKAAALELGVPVIETNKITPEVLDRIRAETPDVICVAAYGCILPDEVLDVARLGCVNVHGSPLPRWRGAAPIQRGVLEGDDEVGVSIMRVVHDLDAGAYCRQATIAVGQKTCTQLMSEVAQLGADELLAALGQMETGEARWVEQDESQVTYAKKISKVEMRLDPADDVAKNARRIQASTDAAPARLKVGERGVRVLLATVSSEPLGAGRALVRKGRVFLGCADGSLELLRVKPDGKKEMDASAWAQGLHADGLTWGRL